MTTTTLQQVQATLKQRGVQDVKFLFTSEAHGKLGSDVLADVVDVLNKYLHLQGSPMDMSRSLGEVLPAPFTN